MVPGAIPTGLMLDIPSQTGGFPAFSNVAMPDADPLEITASGSIGAAMVFTWN